jgi:hypothetical protein
MGDNIKIYVKYVWRVCVDWTNAAQGRDMWSAFVKTFMNMRVPENARSIVGEVLLATQGLRDVDLVIYIYIYIVYISIYLANHV